MLDIRIQAKLLPHNRLVKSIQPAKPKDPRPNNSTTNKANHQHVAKKDESRLTPLRWDGRGGSSRLVTTWPLLMPTKRPDLGCVGAMSPNPLPAHAQTKGEISLSGSGRRGFQIGVGGGGGARRGLTLPGEVNRRLPRRNPSRGEGLYRRRRGGGLARGEKWAVLG